MIDSLYIAATGMHAQQLGIDVIANNLSNVNTPAFKKSRVDFQDLMYQPLGRNLAAGAEIGGQRTGLGAGIAGANKLFAVGDLKKTERAYDLAIRGDGFFEVILPDGSYGYTRNGATQVDGMGMLVNTDGYLMSPVVQIPRDAQDIVVTGDGTVLARVSGERDLVELGRMELARFMNPGGLEPLGDNLYKPTDLSGDAFHGRPGEDGVGALAQGFLEASNVALVEELTNLVLAQRAYEMNAKVVQVSDEILGIINNLRR